MIQSTHEAVGSTNSINTEVGLREKTFAMAQAGGSELAECGRGV